ncbi:MAG: hypothetical protein Q7T66_10440 [Herminiimonas sp.]|uniref:phosphorylase family protein n=1 Tax=Herminiimonas sp. TaxID=1926289 RepID=UPI00271DE39A|nr:hypothetical protein [Herminiimonas sp.]MDO9421071.1 hypothetical protein [Herminiimonas sp.]
MSLQVLLLEDDPSKKIKLLKFLQESSDFIERIDTAICTDDAERFLCEHTYDLFIVDIVVPKSLAGEKHERNSIALLESLDERATSANVPRFILPISSSLELSDLAHGYFIGRPWGILPYNDTDDNALKSIQKVAAFISSQSHISVLPKCDVLIITALIDPEFTAIEALPLAWGAYEPLDEQHLMRRGTFQTAGITKEVVAVFCLRMGPVQAAILTTKCLVLLNPKLVIMGGICAGLPGKTEIGDVVAADVSWDWQSGKFVDSAGEDAFQIAPHQLDIGESLRSPLILFKKDNQFWQSFAMDAVQHKTTIPKLVIGPMATGSSVLADERITARIKLQQHKNVVGLDMETYGVYAAVQSCAPHITVISLKAVCDKGDLQKNDDFQEYAASVSARAISHFLTNYSDRLL